MTRSLIAIVTGLVVAAVLLAAAGPGADAAARPGFAPGTWVGKGSRTGIADIGDGNPSPAAAKLDFTLVVDRNLRASGTVTFWTRHETTIGKMHGVLVGKGTLKLSGSGSDVRYSGTLSMAGELREGNVTVPWKTAKPLSGRLLITRAGCTLVVGKTDQRFAVPFKAVPKPGTPRFRCS